MSNKDIIIEITFDKNGFPQTKSYYYIEWHNAVVFGLEDHYQIKHYHNLNGPACIDYDNGIISSEWYYKDGYTHNLNGPAIIDYYEDGSILDIGYRINGYEIQVKNNKEFEDYKKHLCLM